MAKFIITNTLTNYITMIVRLIEGILVTRYLISYLGEAYYGLWTMLWSFFCYAVLLDFGFGLGAQKSTATQMHKEDINTYNSTISTIFVYNLFMSSIILITTSVGAYFIRVIFHLSDMSEEFVYYSRVCFILFGCGSALTFPFGVFSEILVGLQRIYLRNNIMVVFKILELCVFFIIIYFKGSIILIIVNTLTMDLLSKLMMYPFILKYIPELKLRIVPNKSIFKKLFSFSSYVFLVAMARRAWVQGGFMVISIIKGLDAVATYHIGIRVPGLVIQAVSQYQENVSPLSASLYAQGKIKELGSIIVNSMRWNSFLASILCIGVVVFAEEIMRFLFNFQSDIAISICRVILIEVYFGVTYCTMQERYFLMTNSHKFIAIYLMLMSILLIVTLVTVLPLYGIIAVAWTKVALRTILPFTVLMPRIIKELKLSAFKIFRDTILRPLISVIPIFLIFLQIKKYSVNFGDFYTILIATIVGIVIYPLICAFTMINSSERLAIINKTKKFFNKGGEQ